MKWIAPFAALVICLGCGFLAGFLLGRANPIDVAPALLTMDEKRKVIEDYKTEMEFKWLESLKKNGGKITLFDLDKIKKADTKIIIKAPGVEVSN